MATTHADDVASIDLTDDDAHFVRLEVVEEDKTCSPDLTVMPSRSQASTNAVQTPGKPSTLSLSNTPFKRECVHDEEGVLCDVHGAGAKEYWRPAGRMIRGRRGSTPIMKHAKEYYYSCDVVIRGRGRMKQTTLSAFLKTTNIRKTNTQNTGVPVPDRDAEVLRGDHTGSMTVKKTL